MVKLLASAVLDTITLGNIAEKFVINTKTVNMAFKTTHIQPGFFCDITKDNRNTTTVAIAKTTDTGLVKTSVSRAAKKKEIKSNRIVKNPDLVIIVFVFGSSPGNFSSKIIAP